MKIDCKPNARESERERDNSPIKSRLWKQSLPFNVNPRGVLIHRVRCAGTCVHDGKYSHDWVHYWCGNQTCGEGLGLVEVPPTDRLLCVYCEQKAVAHGEPTAEALAGRHVCIGVMKAHRLCCRNEGN